jgi:molybdopterin converting factor small subunit
MAEIRYLGQIQRLTLVKCEELEVKSVAELLKTLEARYGRETYKQAKRSYIIVNNESISLLNGIDTKLTQYDTVSIVPVCAGG